MYQLLRDLTAGTRVVLTEGQIRRNANAVGRVDGQIISVDEKLAIVWLKDARVVKVEPDCLVEVVDG